MLNLCLLCTGPGETHQGLPKPEGAERDHAHRHYAARDPAEDDGRHGGWECLRVQQVDVGCVAIGFSGR